MQFRYLLGALCAAASVCATAAIPAAEQTVAVEFYHAAADHYFIAADPAEISDLDTGKHPGWVRTGYRFSVIKAGSTWPGTVPMCRFFSESLNTHFYSAKPSECEDVKTKYPGVWTFESGEVFRSFPVDPSTGLCPADTTATYRLWNQQAAANHRYTDQLSAYVYMLGKNYLPEGDGNPALPVAFCTPAGGDVVPAASPSAPDCTMTASSGNPAPGSTLSLNAQCTNNATTFLWAGCTSTTSSCTATSAAAGQTTYTLYSANPLGPGAPVVKSITWGAAGGGAVPICTVSASATSLSTFSTLALTANCSQTPTAYEWVECNYLVQSICNPIPACAATSKTCSLGNTIGGAGFARYGVAGTNGAGKGPRAMVDVEWTGGGGGGPPPPPPPPGGGNDPVPTCSAYASNDRPSVGSNVTLTASCTGNPTSYQWVGVQCSQWQCQTSSATAGSMTYTVTARNAAGSAQASVTIEWGGAAPNPVPSCTVAPSNASPQVDSSITVTATCSNNPTSYTWTGCTSTGPSCTDTMSTAGAKSYSVVAANANGSSAPATTNVNWVPAPTSPPACQISASSISPMVGETVTLTATCSNGPTSYDWIGCTTSSTSATCTATATAAGAVTYYVAGINQYGKGTPPAGITVTWQAAGGPPPPPPGGGFCGQFAKVEQINLAWGDITRFKTAQYNGFGAGKVFVMALTVPTSPSSYGLSGYSSVFEYGGPPSLRQVTLSKSACDFRPIDLSGVNGPLDASSGMQATIFWNVGIGSGALLAPGGTYYFNYRNLNCDISSCEAMIENYWPK
ncbi:MAG: hypothetical protein IT518_23130 [Burkholderiales bacterium]|nr:hypothetical protein [Burkholderiales bacterium]